MKSVIYVDDWVTVAIKDFFQFSFKNSFWAKIIVYADSFAAVLLALQVGNAYLENNSLFMRGIAASYLKKLKPKVLGLQFLKEPFLLDALLLM